MSFGLKLLGPDTAYLVVTSTEHEFGVGVVVQDPLDDLALVDGNGAYFKILLADKHCIQVSDRMFECFPPEVEYTPSIGRFRAKLFSSKS